MFFRIRDTLCDLSPVRRQPTFQDQGFTNLSNFISVPTYVYNLNQFLPRFFFILFFSLFVKSLQLFKSGLYS